MSIDLRGFFYPLNPVIQKQEWQVEKCLSLCAKCQSSLSNTRKSLEKIEQDLKELNQLFAANSAAMDMQQRKNYVLFAAHLQTQKQQIDLQLEQLLNEQVHLKNNYVKEKNKLDAMYEHKEQCKIEFARHALQKNYKEADMSWSARTTWLNKAFLHDPKNGSWTGMSLHSSGSLSRRDEDVDYVPLGGTTTTEDRKNG